MDRFSTYILQPGFRMHVLPTDKFKTVRMKMFWRWPLSAQSATSVALLPMVLRRGCASLPSSREIAVHMENMYGASFATDITKIGETQLIEWDLEVADNNYLPEAPDLLRAGLHFIRQLALEPLLENNAFKSSYVSTEKDNLRHRIEGLFNDKPRYALTRLFSVMCSEEPFAIPRYGRLEDIEKITPDSLYSQYENLRDQAPIDIYIVGNVSPESIQTMVNEVFANTSRHLIQIPAIKQKPVNSVRHNEEAQDIKQANLAIGLRSQIGFASDDYPALMVYNGVLGAFPHSKLFVNVREKHSLAYFASSRLESTKRLQYILAGIDSSKYEEALSLIQAQLDDTRAGRFSDTDLSAAQKSIVNGLRSSQDNAGYVIDAHMIGLINNRERQPDELINAVKAVTADDVVRAARQVQLDTVFLLRSTSGKGGASSAK